MATAKTATLPAVRVDPEVRDEAEAFLGEDETLSTFIERAVLECIARRKTQLEFVRRGLAAREEVGRTGVYYTPEFVLDELEAIQADAEAAAKKNKGKH